MVALEHRDLDGVRRSEQAVELLQLGLRLGESARVEEVVVLGEDDDWRLAGGDEEIRHFEALRQRSGGHLLGVDGQFVLDIAQPGGDVAGGRGHGDAVVHGGDPGGQGAAAGVAVDADASGVHLGAAQQVVQSAHGIPRAPGAEPLAQQHALLVQHVVFPAGVRVWTNRRIQKLLTLALTGGIDGQHRETGLREGARGLLVAIAAFALAEVPAEEEHCGHLALAAFRQIEIAGHRVVRTAVVDHLLQRVFRKVHRAGHHRVERALLRREAEARARLAAHVGDIRLRVRLCLQRGDALGARRVDLAHFLQVEFLNRIAEQV